MCKEGDTSWSFKNQEDRTKNTPSFKYDIISRNRTKQ